MAALYKLAERWRSDAERFLAYGDKRGARTCELHANELERAIGRRQREVVSLETAAAESGYSVDHLGRLVREGTIPNAGEPGAPRIRRVDRPRKPGFNGSGVAACRTEPVRSAAQVVRSVLRNGGQA